MLIVVTPKPKSPGSRTPSPKSTTSKTSKTPKPSKTKPTKTKTKPHSQQQPHHAPDIWKDSYKALLHDTAGAKSLAKLTKKLKEAIEAQSGGAQSGRVSKELNLRSNDGYKQLRTLIDARCVELNKKKLASSKAASVCGNLLRLKDAVGAATSAGGPYVAIPVAALFMVFSMEEIYRTERDTMFRLAETITHYSVLSAKCHERILINPHTDDTDMQKLKQTLRIVCIGLYKGILFSCAELANFFYSDWKAAKLVFRTHDWKHQLEDLDRHFDLYVTYRDEMDARPATAVVPVVKQDAKKIMGPACRNPLHWAVALGVPERVSELVSSQEYPINALTPKSWTAAHLAARNNNTGILRTLLTAPGIDLTLKEAEHGRTALHVAAVNNRVGNVKVLLERNRMILGSRDARGRTAYHLAAQKGHVKVLEALKGQDFNEKTEKSEWTGLHFAAENGHVGACRFLVEKSIRILKMRDSRGRTAFHFAAKKGHIQVLEALKEKGQDINEPTSKSGWTGLHFAAENGHVDAVKWLLANGARKELRSKDGKSFKGVTAKQAAEKKGKVEVVKLL